MRKFKLPELPKLKLPKIPAVNWKDPKVKKRGLLILLIVIVAFIVLARTSSNLQNVLFKKKPGPGKGIPGITFEEGATPVKVIKVKRMDFKDTLPCIGNIKGFKEIDLKFQTVGILESFNFEEGEKILEGDIIASLVQRDALLKLKYANIELDKNRKLFEIGAISQMKFDQSKLEYESAKSELDKTNIYATSNGLLGSRLIDTGSYVTSNDKIGTFVQIDKVYAEFDIIEKDTPKLALGQRVEVFVEAYPNKSFTGTVDRLTPVIEGRSRTQTVKIELDNKDNLLRPGMFVRALIATYEKKDTIVVPASSLKKKDAETFVYVVHKEDMKKEPTSEEAKKEKSFLSGLFKRKTAPKPESKDKEPEFGAVEVRPVKLGYITQDLVEVAEGLKEDEIIITEVQEEFKDKAKVEIMEMQEGIF